MRMPLQCRLTEDDGYFTHYLIPQEELTGWCVAVKDLQQEFYGELRSEICGMPVLILDYCFLGCENMIEADGSRSTARGLARIVRDAALSRSNWFLWIRLQPSVNGKTIVDVLAMSVEEAVPFFKDSKKISSMLNALMEVGLTYISLGQPLSTFSGGERQRVKLAQNIKKKDNIYILDEPTTGLHSADTVKVMDILEFFLDRGNTVIVIEHNADVMKPADYIIDVGPDGGTKGGEIVFIGTPKEMRDTGTTIMAGYLK